MENMEDVDFLVPIIIVVLCVKNNNGNGTCKCSHMDKYIKKTTVKQYIQNQ